MKNEKSCYDKQQNPVNQSQGNYGYAFSTTKQQNLFNVIYFIFEVEGRSNRVLANIITLLLLFLRVALENRLDGQFVNPYSFPIF